MICQLFTIEFELDEEKKFINSQREVLFMISVVVDIWMPSEYYPKMNTFRACSSSIRLHPAYLCDSMLLNHLYHVLRCNAVNR